MRDSLDLVVIGTGSAGATAAGRCREAGWTVAIVDSSPLGGTCALRGCDPKKVLVGAAEIIDRARRMEGNGIAAAGLRMDWPELMRFKRSFTDPVPKRREESFAQAGIAALHGRARFIGPDTVRIGGEALRARHFVIAAGAKPGGLGIPGAEHLVTSDRFLELEALPARIVFAGGGYISFEFAHVAARAGAHAVILHRGPRPLERFDPDLVDVLVERTRRLGVEVELNTEVAAIERSSGGFEVHATSAGRKRRFEADLVVHGAGRVPDIDDLDLPAGGIERDSRGIVVNEYLQSASNPAVYAAGDAAASGGPPLTPVAGYEGQVVAENLVGGNHRKPDYSGVPSVVFTLPPLASVGLDEKSARRQGLRFRTRYENTAGWYSSRRVGEEAAGFKVLIEEPGERILGAHLLGPHAEEAINLFALAIRWQAPAPSLRDALFAYPTHGSDIRYML